MNIKLLIFTLVLCAFCSVTLGTEPMGPPTSSLDKGQWSIGLDISKSEIDFKLKNTKGTSFFTRDKAQDFEFRNTLGKLSHGLNDNIELYVGFGISKSEYKELVCWEDGGSTESVLIDYECDTGFAAKAGAKATFLNHGPLELGALLQLEWLTMEGDYAEASWTDGIFNDSGTGEFDADIFILKFAPGVSYDINSDLIVYGGPLMQWIDGDGNADGKTGSLTVEGGTGDLRQDSSFGGLIGLQAGTSSNTMISLELQVTGTSRTVGFNLSHKF